MKKTYLALAILLAGLLVASDAYATYNIGVFQNLEPRKSIPFNTYRAWYPGSDRWLGSGYIYEIYVYWHNKFSKTKKITRQEYEKRAMIAKTKCLEKIKKGQDNRNEDSASD